MTPAPLSLFPIHAYRGYVPKRHTRQRRAGEMKKIRVIRVDDMDGSEAADTVRFSYQGKSYEIDLSEDNHKRFDDMMGSVISRARPIKRGSKFGRHKSTARASEVRRVREWARGQGRIVGERGPLPSEVVAEYRKVTRKRAM